MKYLVMPTDICYDRTQEIDCNDVDIHPSGTLVFTDDGGFAIHMINNSAWKECYVVPEDAQ